MLRTIDKKSFFLSLSVEERKEFIENCILECKLHKNSANELFILSLVDDMIQHGDVRSDFTRIVSARFAMYDAMRIAIACTNSWK